MLNNMQISRVAVGASVIGVMVVIFVAMQSSQHVKLVHVTHTVTDDRCISVMKQRNEISRQLNEMKQEYGRLSCEHLELQQKSGKNVEVKVSASGGWCKFAGMSNSSSHVMDKKLAEALSKFFQSKRVASFGDGPGEYKRYIDTTKRLDTYDAYDGAPYAPETSGGRVHHLDLSAPQFGMKAYDWILSLEVAEHIPQKFESIYLDNIARHAKEGVVLSWAVPGQGGLSHVNNQPLSHVISEFAKRGFRHSKEESVMLQKNATLAWLINNVNVYRRVDLNLFNVQEL